MKAKKIGYAGYSMTTLEWSESIGIKTKTLAKRFRKMGIEKALTYRIKKRLERWRDAEEEKKRVELLKEIEAEEQRRKEAVWAETVDNGVHSYQLLMLSRGYFRKGSMQWRYKMLNTWYKEFRSENMKAA